MFPVATLAYTHGIQAGRNGWHQWDESYLILPLFGQKI